MAKKRGGLAGLYDSNKGLFRTAGILAGTGLGALVGGPAGAKAGGALAGAAFRGFDRPGQRGIGFDVGQGIQGGLEGYAMGKTASGLKGMFAPKAASAAAAQGVSEETKKNAIQQLLSGLTQRQGTGNRPLYYDLLSGTGKGLLSERQSQRTEALKRAEMEENKRQFDALFGLRQQDAAIAAAQEADRKRREEQRMANREALRALFTGA
jgi:hypothetical protein